MAKKVEQYPEDELKALGLDKSQVEEEKETEAKESLEAESAEESEEVSGEQEESKEKKGTSAKDRIQQLIEERRKLEETLAAEKALREQYEKRMQELLQNLVQQEPAKTTAEEKPDPTIDPIGAELYEIRNQLRELQSLREALAGVQNQTFYTDLNAWHMTDVQRFRSEHPDYDDAVRYGAEQRQKFWESVGYDPLTARRIVEQEAAAVAIQARQSGRSAAQAYYEFAKTVGWRGRGAETTQPRQVVSSKEKLRKMAEGQKFQGIGGRTPAVRTEDLSQLTAEDVANMSDEEFARLLSDPKTRGAVEAALRKLEGVE